jgi:hypothetical protein
MHKCNVRIAATVIATGEEIGLTQPFDYETEGQLSTKISQTLFAVGQTGIVEYQAATQTWRAYLPHEISNLHATRRLIALATDIDIQMTQGASV